MPKKLKKYSEKVYAQASKYCLAVHNKKNNEFFIGERMLNVMFETADSCTPQLVTLANGNHIFWDLKTPEYNVRILYRDMFVLGHLYCMAYETGSVYSEKDLLKILKSIKETNFEIENEVDLIKYVNFLDAASSMFITEKGY